MHGGFQTASVLGENRGRSNTAGFTPAGLEKDMNSDRNVALREAVDFLYSLPKFTTKNSLEHTAEFLRLLGSPCKDRKIIHVAGSNGKGSVCSFLYHILLASGKSVGLFTSPHLVDIRERFCVNGHMVSEEEFLDAYREVRRTADALVRTGKPHPTFFEFLFGCGMLLFERSHVEYVVLETGLGGRLDATNSFPSPLLCVITSISLEHTEILGHTIPEIAAEKAGILKPGVPVVYTNRDPEAAKVIAARAFCLGCPAFPVSEECCAIRKFTDNSIDFSFYSAYDEGEEAVSGFAGNGKEFPEKERSIPTGSAQGTDSGSVPEETAEPETSRLFTIPFGAPYQVENAALALVSARLLGIRDVDTLRRGLQNTVWPGRMQEVQPGIWLDGAHNPSGIAAFTQAAARLGAGDPYPPLLLFSMLQDKDVRTSVRLLLSGVHWGGVAVCGMESVRGLPAEELAGIFTEYTVAPVQIYESGAEAFSAMKRKRQEGQKLFVTGSLYFIGSLLEANEKEEK